MLAGTYLETRNPRTNLQDDVAWGVWCFGMSLIGVGVGVVCRRSCTDLVILGVVFPIAGFLLLVAAFWGFIIARSFL